MNHVFILFIKLLFLRITLVSAAGRKYDLDEESRTLYGENLTEVLNKFRRTPEYVEILLERNNKLQNRIQSIMSQADHYFQSVLDKEIEDKIRDSVTKNPPRTAAFRSKNRHTLYIHRRQDGEPEPEPDKPGGGGGGGGGAEGPNPEDIDVIAKLDEFFAMTRPMSAVEKNEWRDWAFDQLPRLIDYIVAPLGSEGRHHGGITKAPVDTEPKPAPKPEPEPEPEPALPLPPEDGGDTKEGGDEGAGGGEPPNEGNQLKEACRDGKTEAKPRIKGHTMPTANPKVKKSKNVIMLY